jgi:hypothetical protein
MSSLRTDPTEKKYEAFLAERGSQGACPLCIDPSEREFTHWKILKNNFPYDRIAAVHDLIVPIRHVPEQEITPEEWAEYQQIKKDVLKKSYEYILEPVAHSIPGHFHLHLIVAKP